MTSSRNVYVAEWRRNHYEVILPSGRIISSETYSPGLLGDLWYADDGHAADSVEFHEATIRFDGGPRHGESVS